LSVASLMILMSFLRQSSSFDWGSALWIAPCFSPPDQTGECVWANNGDYCHVSTTYPEFVR
jgi:hypothetical protein